MSEYELREPVSSLGPRVGSVEQDLAVLKQRANDRDQWERRIEDRMERLLAMPERMEGLQREVRNGLEGIGRDVRALDTRVGEITDQQEHRQEYGAQRGYQERVYGQTAKRDGNTLLIAIVGVGATIFGSLIAALVTILITILKGHG